MAVPVGIDMYGGRVDMVSKIMVSACLVGENCRYNAECLEAVPELLRLVEEGRAVPVCPEVMGGAPVPREPCEIRGGDGFDVLDGRARVFDRCGADVTGIFLAGAAAVLDAARRDGVRTAVLKERSPSCGSSMIYDGSFTGKRVPGSGCTAALLAREGIAVYSEENFKQKACFVENKS